MSPAGILGGTSCFIFHTRPDSALPCAGARQESLP